MGWGQQSTGGGNRNLTTREGGGKILDASRKGGAKNVRLDQFFSMFLKHNYFMFWGILDTFHFLPNWG